MPEMVLWHGGGWRQGRLSGQCSEVAEVMRAKGIGTHEVTYPAHGNIQHCCWHALGTVIDLEVAPILFGISAGAQMALYVASKMPVAAVIGYCPVLNLKTFRGWDVSDQSTPELNPMEMPPLNIPMLFVLGQHDTLICADEVKLFARKQQARVLVYSGAHDFFSGKSFIHEDVHSWLVDNDCV